MTRPVRVFFAIELPVDARRAIALARDRLLLDRRHWRIVLDERLHLTVRFVGETDPARLAALEATGQQAAADVSCIDCDVGGVGAYPNAHRPRVLWVGVTDRSSGGELVLLAQRLEDHLRTAGFPPEGRRLEPHVTIARAGVLARAIFPRPVAPSTIASVVASGLTLFRSQTFGGGARYEPIASFPFKPGPA